MYCSSKLKRTTPRRGESPPSRGDKAPPVAPGASGVDQALADKLLKISVRGAPHQTHTLELKLSDTVADLNAAVEELGYDLSVDRLCHLGGPPVPHDDRLTLADAGLKDNSSLQVLGRLRGGAEVTLFGQQHSLGDTGLLDLKGQDVGPAKLKEVAEFFSSPESGAVRRLILSGNMITDRGKDLSGLKALCEVLPTLKHPISLDLVGCGLGVAEVNEVAAAIHAGAAVASLKMAGANFGPIYTACDALLFQVESSDRGVAFRNSPNMDDRCEDGAGPDALEYVYAIHDTDEWLQVSEKKWLPKKFFIQVDTSSPCTFCVFCDALRPSPVTEVDFSSCGLGPAAMPILSDYVRDATAAVEAIAIGANPITSEGGAILLEAIKTSKLKTIDIGKPLPLQEPYESDTLDLSKTKMDPGHVLLLSWWLGTEFSAALNSVTVDSTGDTKDRYGRRNNGGPKTYTLTVGEEKIDLSHKNLGSADVALVTTWLQRPEVKAAVTSINCLANQFGEDDLATLLTAIEGTSVRSLCGLTEGQTTADFSGQNLRPIDMKIMAAEYGFQGFIAAVARLTLSGNAITNFGKDLTGLKALCEALLGLKNPISLDLANCNFKVAEVNELAQAIQAGAAVASLALSRNGILSEYSDGSGKADYRGLEEWGTFCSVLATSKIEKLMLERIGIGPVALQTLATSLPAAVARLTLSGNAISGSTKKRSLSVMVWDKFDLDLAGFISLCEALPNLKNPIHLDLADCGLSVNGMNELSKAMAAGAALNSLKCANNPGMVGELQRGRLKTPDVHAEVFKQLTDNLKTSQVTEVDFSSCGIGPVALGHLSEWVRDAEAAVASLRCGNNPSMVGKLDEYGRLETPDAHAEVFKELTDSLKTSQVTEADFSSCGLGPVALGHLSDSVREATAALTSINCLANQFGEDDLATLLTAIEGTSVRSLCGLTEGQTTADFSGQNIGPIDMKMMAAEFGFQGFIAALNSVTVDSTGDPDYDNGGPKPYTLTVGEDQMELSSKNLGPADVALVAAWLQRPEVSAAPVKVVILDGNPIGHATVSMQPGANTGVPIKSGTFVCFDGRIAEVHQDPDESDSGKLKKLTWVDSGENAWNQGNYIKASEVSSCVGNRSDLIFDYSHIQALGETLSKVEQLSLADCKFTSATLATFAESVTWANAAVEAIAIGANPITSEGGAILLEAIKTSKLKTIDIGKPLPLLEPYESDTLDLSNTRMDPGHVLLLSWWLGTEFSAAVASLRCGNNPGMVGKLNRYGRLETPDANADVFKELTDGLKTSKVTEADFSSCGIGPVALGHLSDWVRDATAAVASLRCGNNPGMVGKLDDYGNLETPDAHAEVFKELTDSLKTSQVTEADFSSCGIGPVALGHLGEWVREANAALNEVNIAFNQVGSEGGIALRDALKTSNLKFLAIGKMYTSAGGAVITGSQVTTGVTLSSGGRLGELIKGPDSDFDVKLKWADTGEESSYMKLHSLDGEPLKLPLQSPFEGEHLDLAYQQLDPGYVLLLSWWLGTEFSAAINSLTIDSTGDMGYQKTYTLTTGQDKIELNEKNLGPADIKLISTWITTSGAIGRLILNDNPLTGGENDDVDRDLSGVTALFDTLKTSPVTELGLAKCRLGPGSLGKLAEYFCEANARCTTLLDLRHNGLSELPLELTRLDRLETLEIDAGNPGLGTATQILQNGGMQDLFEYVRELHDDPRPSYSLKVVLAGPSMAGKSSLLNALRLREARLTDPEHGRTIGLDIERIELHDPRAGKHVVVFLAYDAGGHDEYQEMHQSFFSDHTLYILVWNVALTNDVEMQEAQAAWASLIQTCAPGSKVLLVASHADEVKDADVVARRCNEMTRAVRVLLDQHRQAQQAELDRLVATPSLDVDSANRKVQLERILDRPLRLADDAVVVSSNTLVGVDTLRRRMLDEAFDKSQFPSFGESQPYTYEFVLRELRRCHADQTSVSWPEMQDSLSRRPDVDGQHFEVQLLKSQEVGNAEMSIRRLHRALDTAKAAQFESLRDILLSGEPLPTSLLNSVPAPRDYGILHQLAYHGATDEYLFLVENGVEFDPAVRTTKDGSTAAEIADMRNHPMFASTLLPPSLDDSAASLAHAIPCQIDGKGPFVEDLRVELSATGILTLHVSPLDKRSINLSDSNATVTLPKVSKRPFCLQVTQSKLNQCVLDACTGLQFEKWRQALCRFASLEGAPFQLYTFSISLCGEQMSEFSIRYSAAQQLHSELAKQQRLGIKFPGKQYFGVDVALREQELEAYYRQLFQRHDAATLFSEHMGLDLADMKAQRCRLSDKVGKDPDLIRRAIRYLRITGEVIWPDYENKPALRERVFIFPQKLVDAMKELVHHDLESQFDAIDDQTSDTVRLGREFCSTGVLHRELLPWLWRNLHSVVRDDAQVDFMANLLAQLGLLTLVPGSEPQRWLLPLRLPDRAHVLASASAHSQFAAFLQELGTGAEIATATLPVALDAIARAGILKAEELAAGLEVAYRKADELLRGRLVDDNGLSRDEIAAVHLYTQENLVRPQAAGPPNIYWPMNRGLRMLQFDVVRAFWLYIMLLQSALLKIPPAKDALYRGLRNPQPPIAISDLNVQIADRSAYVWWAFTSTTTDESVARNFCGSTGDRVLYTVTKGTARDVGEYSAIPTEAELLMPAGTAFITTDAQHASRDDTLLEVALEQTEARLLEAAGAGSEVDVHRHPRLAELAATLDHVRTDFVGRRYDFHQPLPAGLLAIVISRCATLCDERTSIWRRDLVTVMQTSNPCCNSTLLAMKMPELQRQAAALKVSQAQLNEADDSKERIAELIVAALQMELTIKQQGASRIAVHARSYAGFHHMLLREKVRLFENELATVVAEQWKGCSATVMCVLDDHRAVPLSDCQHAAARGALSVEVEGSTVQLSDLGFDEHDRDGTPSISEGLPPLRTWELEPGPEQRLEFETDFEPEPEPEPRLESGCNV